MTRVYCDRCKEVADRVLSVEPTFGPVGLRAPCMQLDLCPECYASLERWRDAWRARASDEGQAEAMKS